MSHTGTGTDNGILLDTGNRDWVCAVAFSPDGTHLLSGSLDAIRRFRLADKVVTERQTGMDVNAISISKDGQWMVCGTEEGASVWDAELEGKVCEVEVGKRVGAVDVSPDATRFATWTRDETSVWDISTGERLVGPVKFKEWVTGIRFSPDGEQIAISERGGPITIVDSRMVTIKTKTVNNFRNTPIAWMNDGLRLLAACDDNKVRSFDTSTGSLLAESQVIHGDNFESIALAANGQFIATYGENTIFFLDASSLALINPTIKGDSQISSIALTSDSTRLATGRRDGKILVRDLTTVDIFSAVKQTSSNSDSYESDVSSTHDSRHDNRDDDTDLLEVEVPSSAPAPAAAFNFDKPPSPISSVHLRDQVPVPPVEVLCATLPSPPKVPSPPSPQLRSDEHPETATPSMVHQIRGWLKKWARRRSNDRTGRPSTGTMAPSRRPQVHLAPNVDCSEGSRQHAPSPPPQVRVPATAKYLTRQYRLVFAQQSNDSLEPRASRGDATVVPKAVNQTRPDRMTISVPTWLVCFRPCIVDEAD